MGKSLAYKLIESHLVKGEMKPGEEIELKIDQTLTQDATGTMVMLELEAMGCKQVKTELSAQYVDHNLLQTDFKNPDDHLFLQSACARFGIWYSPAGNGVSHPVHMERFGIPGKTLLGSDSHTCAAGSLGMFALGAGGLEVAFAMMGEPFVTKMPEIIGVKLTGELPPWVSAKDVVLEMLRRYDVKGGVRKLFEYYGPGLKQLDAMDRHVIANMGQEMGATATVFPADEAVQQFLEEQGRGEDYVELLPDEDAEYDAHEEINLSELVPLIAKPSSPGNVVPVSEVAGAPIYQSMVGSSANPGFRDFAIAGMIVAGKKINPNVSFDINPSSRQILENLTTQKYLQQLIHSGARIHQAGCNGCIGMGQAPATGQISLRTVPRNFPGRSGTDGDQVYLCSPEVAAASALTGKITDPRTLDMEYPRYQPPSQISIDATLLVPPSPDKADTEIIRGPNIKEFPKFDELPEQIEGPVMLKGGDNVSTDEILPGGQSVLPLRSNVPEISKFTMIRLDPTFYERCMARDRGMSIVVGGINWGQGSSREHAVIAPRWLGVRCIIAKSMARIHRKNLINFGVLPLYFIDDGEYENVDQGDELVIANVSHVVRHGHEIEAYNKTKNFDFKLRHDLSDQEREMVLAGGLINWKANKEK